MSLIWFWNGFELIKIDLMGFIMRHIHFIWHLPHQFFRYRFRTHMIMGRECFMNLSPMVLENYLSVIFNLRDVIDMMRIQFGRLQVLTFY